MRQTDLVRAAASQRARGQRELVGQREGGFQMGECADPDQGVKAQLGGEGQRGGPIWGVVAHRGRCSPGRERLCLRR